MLYQALITMAIAATPVLELRAAIPLAIGYYGFGNFEAFVLALVGNLAPVPILAWLLPQVELLLKRTNFGVRFFDWWTKRTRSKIARLHTVWGIDVALVLFVAVPFPGTGAWSGALAGWLLGLKPWRITLDVGLGLVIAAIIVLLATLGVIQLL